jgi:hypothetical protein
MPKNIRARQAGKLPPSVRAAMVHVQKTFTYLREPLLNGSIYRVGYGRAVVMPPSQVVETDELLWLRGKLMDYYLEEKTKQSTFTGLTNAIVARFERIYKGL